MIHKKTQVNYLINNPKHCQCSLYWNGSAVICQDHTKSQQQIYQRLGLRLNKDKLTLMVWQF